MKDNLFEMLLSLFEKSLTQLQESHKTAEQEATEEGKETEHTPSEGQLVHLKLQEEASTRVFTYNEQIKLTKASYQFIMRMKLLNIFNAELFEIIMNQLQFSDSRIVTLQETKWTIRNVLSNSLSEEQLAFLDLVLYQTEDGFAIH
jgi:Smg protein